MFHLGEEVPTSIDQSEWPAAEHLIVLRSPSAHPAVAALLLELMNRSQRVAVVEDAPTVMVELHRGGQAVVLMDESPRAAELVAAVTRYYPRVALWVASRDPHHERPRLTRIVSAASVSAASHPAEESHHHATPEAASALPPVTVGTAAIVSEEELAMLMGPMEE